MANILEHVLVPKHEILTAAEKKELLKRYKIKKENLPKISAKDVVAQNMDAKPGDILRIIRNSQTAGKSLYYRLVVK
jgi:DNA-directed RNA polymerase subunit H